MKFFVFSFNRADCLKNCIQSIESCVSNPAICIVDDNSCDPETVELLKHLESKHDVLYAETTGENVRGGLYPNMQLALDSMGPGQTFCFLQDDMQMVRPVTQREIHSIHQLLERQLADQGTSRKPIAFLHPIFLKGQNKSKDQRRMQYDERTNLYFRQGKGTSSRRYFAAVFISHSSLLMHAGWQFEATELANDQRAEQQFARLGFLANPFAMWLPNVPVWRGKKKTLAIKLAERRNRCGLYPFKIMTAERADAFSERDKAQMPFAESCLEVDYAKAIPIDGTSEIRSLREPWRFSALSGEKILQILHNWELRCARRQRSD